MHSPILLGIAVAIATSIIGCAAPALQEAEEHNLVSNTLALENSIAHNSGLSWKLDTSNLASPISYKGMFRAFTPDSKGLIIDSEGKSWWFDLNGDEQGSFEGYFATFTPDDNGVITYSDKSNVSRWFSLDA